MIGRGEGGGVVDDRVIRAYGPCSVVPILCSTLCCAYCALWYR